MTLAKPRLGPCHGSHGHRQRRIGNSNNNNYRILVLGRFPKVVKDGGRGPPREMGGVDRPPGSMVKGDPQVGLIYICT